MGFIKFKTWQPPAKELSVKLPRLFKNYTSF